MTKLPYRVVFFGTPDFAVPILNSLAEHTHVVLTVSQPDKPSGRGCKVCKPPVKVAAEQLGIDVIQPNIAKGRRFAERIAAAAPDFIVTAAYGKILGERALLVPKKCALNVHASLLPKYRGAAPAAWAVINGDAEAGVCIMRMAPELDAGPVFHRVKTPIQENETGGELLERLSYIGADAAVEALRRFDSLSPVPQDHTAATYARMLTKQDGLVNWAMSARTVHNHIRGMSPWPAAVTFFAGESLKIHRARVLEDTGEFGTPGQVIHVSRDGIDVACGAGILRLLALQAPGKKRLEVQAFILGHSIPLGTIFATTADS